MYLYLYVCACLSKTRDRAHAHVRIDKYLQQMNLVKRYTGFCVLTLILVNFL